VNILYHHRTQGGGVEAVHIRGIVDGLRAMGHAVQVVGPTGTALPSAGRLTPAFGHPSPRQISAERGHGRKHAPTIATSPSPSAFDGEGRPKGGVRPLLALAARRLPQTAFELLELAYNFAAYPRLLQAARATGAEVLYERAAAYTCAGAMVSRRLGIPLVVEFNDVAGLAGLRRHRFAALARRLEASVLRQAGAVITITSYLYDRLRDRGVEAGRLAIIANGVDPERFRPNLDGSHVREQYGVGPGDRLVGFCGAMSPWYRLVDVVQEFAATFAHAPHVRLLLIGDGPEREALRERIAHLDCGRQILMGPRVPHDEVPAHLAAFDVALLPHCNQHGSPVKLFEYLAMAKPVVAVRTPGITDIVRHGQEALLAEPDDLGAVMAYVSRLAENRLAATALGERGRQLVLARHTWQHNAERTYAVLEAVTRVPQRPTGMLDFGFGISDLGLERWTASPPQSKIENPKSEIPQ
jgi:glycosyltransferase involved in cell wall biosynthesis